MADEPFESKPPTKELPHAGALPTAPRPPRGGLASTAPPAAPGDNGANADGSPLIFQPGDILGGVYQIVRLLGEGGMGQVFEAYDHSLERRIAIKASWPDAERFLRQEARALAAFQHPALPAVYSLGAIRDIDYLVMERLHGIDLAEHTAMRAQSGAPFSVQEVLELTRAVAEGLSVIHHAGLVHRDIKPENIMIMPNRRVALMDLGLAIGKAETVDSVTGTPAYMASEALAGHIEPGRTHQLDIYALGVIAFEMLTGQLPRDQASLRSLVEAHGRKPPDPRQIRKDVPPRLADLLEAMLTADPADRPSTIEDVLRELKAVETGRPAAASGAQLRLLVVDDDPDIVKVLGFYARRALGDVDIHWAANGQEALEQLHEHMPDIMLLDLHMPKMNGIEVCMYMQGARVDGKLLAEHCAVIAVSAGAPEGDKRLLQSMGIRHFLEKGQRLGDRLEAALRDVCGQG